MRASFISKIALLLLGLFLFYPKPQTLKAENLPGGGLTISPPLLELNLKPGETYVGKIKITNTSEKMMEVYPQAMNFRAKGEGGEPEFFSDDDSSNSYALSAWLKFSPRKLAFTLEQYTEWDFQIVVPQNAEPGGHYGVIFFSTEPPEVSKDITQIALQTKIGSLILVKVAGAIEESAFLKEFSAPHFLFKPPVDLVVRIQNTGNVHIKPQGEISLLNWQGKLLSELPINEKSNNVLPDSTRKFDAQWQATQKPFYKMPIGKFSGDIKIVYGETAKTLNGEVSFWVIPWWFIILVAIVLIFLIILIWRKIKKRRKRRKPERIIIR